jgi:uncharacterized repeat protein (TIGR01451 family)
MGSAARRVLIPIILVSLMLNLNGTVVATNSVEPRSLGNFDIRVGNRTNLLALISRYSTSNSGHLGQVAQTRALAMQAGLNRLRAAAPGAEIRLSSLSGAAELVRNPRNALTGPSPSQNGPAIVLGFLRANQDLYGLNSADIAALRILGESVSPRTGLRMVRVEQQINGLPVFQSDTRFILDRDGRLIRSVGALAPAASSAAAPPSASISAPEALRAALASVDVAVDVAGMRMANTNAAGSATEVLARDTQISGAVTSRLVYFPLAPGLLAPAWSQVTFTAAAGDWYTLVDAQTGTLLWRKNIRSDGLTRQSARSGATTLATVAPVVPAPAAVMSASLPAAPLQATTQNARFSVYVQADGKTPADSPAPHSPTDVTSGSHTQFPAISRTIVSMLNAQDPIASPNGWIPDGGTTTTGNNVDAYMDRVSGTGETNVPDIGTLDNNGRPVGNPDGNGNNRDFLGTTPRDYSYNPAPLAGNPDAGDTPTGTAAAQTSFRRGAVTQLFYTANWYHDQLYKLGFDEAAGNFQMTNFSGHGLGGDPVLAEAQDGSGTDNANFSTPPDGQSGRMQMFRFIDANPNRDGDLDDEIVIHELTHGLSNRLIGNSSGILWSVASGMGEGWSDFYSLSLLNGTNADDPNGSYAEGAYATYKLGGLLDNYLYGIRRFPYSTNNAVNPLTWADVDDVTANMVGGIPISPLGFEFNGALEVHNIGEIWALSLWEVRSRIIADPAGANGDVPSGNQTMLQLTTDALKLTPINPSFVDARDALLDADCATNACANERWIWEGFADRGLGYDAVAPLGEVGFSGFGQIGVGASSALPHLDVANVAVNDSLGNNNGSIDPGESIALTVTLKNPWRNAARGVALASATLSSATPGVTILDNSSTYGAIPAAGTAAGDAFRFTLDSAVACGQSLKLTLQIASALGTTSVDLPLRVGNRSGTATPIIYTRTIPGGLSIPDNDKRGVTDQLNITDDLEIADLNFRVNNLAHPFTGDLMVLLRAPNGYGSDLIWLRQRLFQNGGAGANFINTVIDDQATSDLNQSTSAAAPFTGSWLPAFNSPVWNLFGNPNIFPDQVGQLSRLNGRSTQGAWQVHVTDGFLTQSGKLNSWSLIVTPRAFTCAAFTPAAAVLGTKTVGGVFAAGGAVTYTVVLTNTGTGAQADNPGNEFVDVLPSQLTLVSASATSGSAVATVATSTVTWNGALAPLGGAVTLTINASVKPGTAGQNVANQGSISFDADSNGTNEASAITDNPGTPAPNDSTAFTVAGLPATTVAATKLDSLLVDLNSNGLADPGDTLSYTVVISNSGGAPASTVLLTDSLDTNTTLVAGSVTASQGSITSGNSAGDTSVGLDIGTLAPASAPATITFQATINAPFPTDVTQVRNQARATGGNFAAVLSDDPRLPGAADPTTTTVHIGAIAPDHPVYLPLVVSPSPLLVMGVRGP